VVKVVKDALRKTVNIKRIGRKYSVTRKKEISKAELENSKRIFKSATPKYTPDWYIKWVASIFVLGAMSLRGVEGMALFDLVLSMIGISLWLVVSILWKDRALILLNGAGLLFLIRNTVEYLT
tara:strand:- start:456 stop:824 length:369 start_codon:yes stop_codon:yes gene_type:complete